MRSTNVRAIKLCQKKRKRIRAALMIWITTTINHKSLHDHQSRAPRDTQSKTIARESINLSINQSLTIDWMEQDLCLGRFPTKWCLFDLSFDMGNSLRNESILSWMEKYSIVRKCDWKYSFWMERTVAQFRCHVTSSAWCTRGKKHGKEILPEVLLLSISIRLHSNPRLVFARGKWGMNNWPSSIGLLLEDVVAFHEFVTNKSSSTIIFIIIFIMVTKFNL